MKWTWGLENGKEMELSVGESWDIEEMGSLDGKAQGRMIRITHSDGSPRNVFEKFDNFVWKNFKGGRSQ
eukprot:gene23852-9408_t